MIIENHSLVKALPEYKDQIHSLKMENTSDEYVEGLKKKRLQLKDQMFGMLKAA